jgi:hypothetical protein
LAQKEIKEKKTGGKVEKEETQIHDGGELLYRHLG